MVELINLSKAARYSKERISKNKVTLQNFITTDNILQNKAGVTLANKLPPGKGSMPAYKEGSILIANIRPYLKKIWFASKTGGCSADVLVIEANEGYNPKYVYYSLFQDNFFIHVMKGKKGTKMPRGDKNQILDFQVSDFEFPIQQKIADVLSALDAKIELNNRMNQELEAMAKILYDYWFVQFDFPDKNGKPYKSSGGKMVWNPELKRKIPEGWEAKRIEEYCHVIDCLHSKKPDLFFENEKYYLLQLENLLDNGLIDTTYKYYVSMHDYKEWTSRIEVKEDDILITNAGRVAATVQVQKEITTGIGRNITAIRPIAIQATYLFLAFRGLDMVKQIKNNTDSGAFFSSFNVKGIKKLFVLEPPTKLGDDFENIVYPIRRKRELLLSENQQLSELRDWLLPMLMNGQVTVS